jgi:hypothetical protein
MDSSEKLSYAVGFLDCWQMFKAEQKDPNTVVKKAYILENIIPQIAASWTDAQIIELINEIRDENIIKKIHGVIAMKATRDQMLKEVEKHKIDWSNLG